MNQSRNFSQNILLGVTGGIAAYKSAEIIRRFQDQACDVRVVMTQTAEKFIGALTLQALSGHPIQQNMFVSDARAMEHIDLARWADKIIIAPATANFIAKIANGQANDLLSTLVLAADGPVYVAPAMNHVMLSNPATQKNIQTLIQNGIQVLETDAGIQACGETGEGRLLAPQLLVDQVYKNDGSLSGKKVLITAGPTREAIDPVRYISNNSSGKMGYSLAKAAHLAGAEVTLISGPVSIAPPAGVKIIHIESAMEMRLAALAQAEQMDIFIASAAVADYRPIQVAIQKIKKVADTLSIQLQQNPDILAEVSALKSRPFCVGFAAETENLITNAKAKLTRKKLDIIIANLVGKTPDGEQIGFNNDNNTVDVLTPKTTKHFACSDKPSLAKKLIQFIAETHQKNE